MKLLWKNLTDEEKLKRVKYTTPFLILAIIGAYWKFDFLYATVVTIVMIVIYVHEYLRYKNQ